MGILHMKKNIFLVVELGVTPLPMVKQVGPPWSSGFSLTILQQVQVALQEMDMGMGQEIGYPI